MYRVYRKIKNRNDSPYQSSSVLFSPRGFPTVKYIITVGEASFKYKNFERSFFMRELQIIEKDGQRVMTTAVLAENYETDIEVIYNNYKRNRDRFIEGEHYYCLQGAELKKFKSVYKVDEQFKNITQLYLWTEKGALLHAKYLNTEKACEIYDDLTESYFSKNQGVFTGECLIDLEVSEEQRLIEKQGKELQIKDKLIGELRFKANYTDSILQNPGLVNINQIAKDYGMSAREMNKLLADKNIQYKQGRQWLLYKNYHDKGYTGSETINVTRSSGMLDVVMRTKWTQKGRLFIYDLLKKDGIYPMVEKNTGYR